MNDISRGVSKLTVRSGSKTNIERRRLGSEKEVDCDRKPGILSSIKRLFVSDAKIDEPGNGERHRDTRVTLPEKPLYHAFKPVPNLPLPQIDDCPEFNVDVCDYMYHFQAHHSADFLENCTITAAQRQRVITFIAERHADYAQPIEAFHLSVFLVDAMMAKGHFNTENAELMCIAALSLASKHERQVGLHRDILRDYSLSKRIRYEAMIFRTMEFCLGHHTVIHLMRILSAALYTKGYKDASEINAWNSAKVLSQVAVMDVSLVGGTKASLLAAAVLRLSLALISRKWVDVYSLQSQHLEEEIRNKTLHLYRFTKKLFDDGKNAVICKIPGNKSGSDFIRGNLNHAAIVLEIA
ncbi:hypothetical protein PRIPAC_86932 [Pristionchus pacificus]|uniref:Cyclin N-terminal domain-containing protein n=1 Tax=Pristionchus pacificus TaxID=54126 RepID=A0A2A6CIT1_PRIPA|nr:hypothetical protein PRIPAC_86932 [Pristionchus pacificus]|eukprot:PDM78016.1 hypothetical protein PRIPAC_35205 [Pristionchus pacificus]